VSGSDPLRQKLIQTLTTGAVVTVTASLALVGCGWLGSRTSDTGRRQDRTRPQLVVLSEAHRFMATRIGGDSVTVDLQVVEAEGSPQKPPARESILAMHNADRILVNGNGQEPWLEKVSLPEGKLVELSSGEWNEVASAPRGMGHRHGPGGAMHRHGLVTRPWLDLKVATHQVQTLREALSALSPEDEPLFRKRAAVLNHELALLDHQFQVTVDQFSGLTVLVVGHDLSAFSHRYGLKTVPVLERPDDEPELFLQELEQKRGANAAALLLLTAPLPVKLQQPVENLGFLPTVLHNGVETDSAGDFLELLRINRQTLDGVVSGSLSPSAPER